MKFSLRSLAKLFFVVPFFPGDADPAGNTGALFPVPQPEEAPEISFHPMA